MMSQKGAGAIMLGHSHSHDQKQTIGFSPASPSVPQDNHPVLHQLDDGPLLVFGRTGSGKGCSSLIPICLEAPAETSLIVVDVKSEVSAVTAAHRRKMGATVHIIDPWMISTDSPSRFNPLTLIGDPKTSPSAMDDAAMLADALVVDWSHHDGFWDQAARSAIQMGCLLLAGHAPDELKHLGALCDALGSGTGPMLTGFLAAGFCSELGQGMVRREAENLASLSGPTLSSITAHLASHLRPLTSPLVRRSLSGSDIDLDALTRGDPMTIYLTIPADRVRSHRAVLRVWLNALVCAIARRRTQPKSRTILLIDELAQLGRLEALPTASFLLRSYGCSVVGYLQAVDQLQGLYPGEWRALLDNAGTVVSLTGGAAMRRLVEITAGPNIAHTMPDLARGDAAVIRDGMVEFIRKADYRKNPNYAHLAALNPFFPQVEATHDH